MIIKIIIRSSKSAILSTTQILVISWVDFWRILVDCLSNDNCVISGFHASSPFLFVTHPLRPRMQTGSPANLDLGLPKIKFPWLPHFVKLFALNS